MKKSVARNEKSCTFAPAKRERGKQDYGRRLAQFFESLRPAQENGPRRSGRRVADTGKGTQENEGGTRDSEENKKNNSTTKSLILAQDER